MSNWLDVRIKLYSDKEQIEALGKKVKDYVYKSTKGDVNASVNFGVNDYKFIWCGVKPLDNFVSVMCYTKVGFDEESAAAVCKWISSKYPSITSIDIQTRDDDSRIFAVYRWTATTPSMVRCRRIDPDLYPSINEDSKNSYSETTVKTLAEALKNSGIVGMVGVHKKHS